MSLQLKNTTDQAIAARASYASATLLTEIPEDWLPESQFTCRHLGTTGYWLIMFNRSSGPTSTSYSIKIGPGEPYTERNPPKGEVWAITSGSPDGDLAWYIGGAS